MYSQNAQNFIGNSNMHAKQGNKTGKKWSPLTSPPPSPPPPIWLLGLDPKWVNFFSKPPQICVQNYQHDEGIILRCVCRGTQDPPTRRPHPHPSTPPPRGPKSLRGCWGQDLTLNTPHVPRCRRDSTQWHNVQARARMYLQKHYVFPHSSSQARGL